MSHIQLGDRRRVGNMVGVEVGGGFDRRRLGVGFGVPLVALQERIALDLALHIGLELEVRQLQQLDRLLQLRGDDKALALPQL